MADSQFLEGLGYFCLWDKTEHRRAKILCMTERGFRVGGILGCTVKTGAGLRKEKCG